nr:hypothetical protein [Tanacetum cinerariifolium]
MNAKTQPEVVTPVKPDDISLPIHRTSGRVIKPPQFYYGFHIKKDKSINCTLSELDEPANYKEAMTSPKAAKWNEVMKIKIQFIYDNQIDMDGNVHTYKARLVAKGYTQTYGINYEETFSPVAKIKSIRIMLAIAVFHDYEIRQMDVKTAFLNKKLTEDVFMAQLEGFKNANYPKRVCKLQKSIYELKQASRSWNLCFHEKVTQFGFSRSEDESCIYVKVSGSVVVFLIYRDMSKRIIGLSHDTYLDKILKRFKIENSKKGNLPLHHGIKISKDICSKTNEELDRMSRVPYASAIGSMMYAMMSTRPDVSFALSMIILLNGGAVTWKSSKQDTVADSTCESKYIVACKDSKEAIWMKNFIGDLGFIPTVQDPIEIFCDNKSAVTLTKEPNAHRKSKHIERKYHFVRSKVEEGHVIVKHIRSDDNAAHSFTKKPLIDNLALTLYLSFLAFHILDEEDLNSVPIYVKIHDMTITTFTEDGLSVIATKLVTPLMLDMYTASMWIESCFMRAMINLVVAVPKIEVEGTMDDDEYDPYDDDEYNTHGLSEE